MEVVIGVVVIVVIGWWLSRIGNAPRGVRPVEFATLEDQAQAFLNTMEKKLRTTDEYVRYINQINLTIATKPEQIVPSIIAAYGISKKRTQNIIDEMKTYSLGNDYIARLEAIERTMKEYHE